MKMAPPKKQSVECISPMYAPGASANFDVDDLDELVEVIFDEAFPRGPKPRGLPML